MSELASANWPGPFPTAMVAMPWQAATTGGDNFRMSGNDLLFVKASASTTLTITLPANSRNRTKTLTISLASGETRVLGPFKDFEGFRGSSGLSVVASATTVSLAVYRLR